MVGGRATASPHREPSDETADDASERHDGYQREQEADPSSGAGLVVAASYRSQTRRPERTVRPPG